MSEKSMQNVLWGFCTAVSSPESRKEFLQLLKLSLPISLSTMQQGLQTTITLLASGHVSMDFFNGASLSIAFMSIVGRAVFNGIGCACDTFFPQSYGSGEKKMLGIWLQRCILLILLACIPVSILFWNAENILRHLGQIEDDVRIAGKITKLYIVGIPAMAVQVPIMKYLYAQGIVLPSLVIACMSNGLYIALVLLLRRTLEIGYVTIGISFSISNIANVILHALYISVTQLHWGGFTTQSLNGWGNLLKVAAPSLAMQLLRTATGHTLTFTAGYLGSAQLAAYSIGDNIWSMADKIAMGIGTATVVRLGKTLGAGEDERARTCLIVAVTLECMVSMSLAIVIGGLSSQLPLLYNSDSEICLQSSLMLKIVSVLLVLESIEYVTLACYRAVGQQLFGAIMNLAVSLMIGLPVALFLMLGTTLGAVGGWFGHMSTATLMVLIGTVRFWNRNWKEESIKARNRLWCDK